MLFRKLHIAIDKSLPVTPIADINIQRRYQDNRLVRSAGVQTVSHNMIPRYSGSIIGTVSSGTATEFYAAGPLGLTTAKRLRLNMSSGVYDFVKNKVIDAGTYTVIVKVRSGSGQGTANFQYGVLSGGGGSMAAVSSTEAGFTTLTTTVTTNGTTDRPRVCIYNNSASAIDILIDDFQWYLAGETIPDSPPAWPANHVLSAEVATPGSMARDGVFLDTRAVPFRGFIPFQEFPGTKTFSAVTIMALVEASDFTRVATKCVVFDASETVLGIGTHYGRLYAAPVLPRASTNPAHYLVGTGWHLLTLRVQANEQSVWLDKFKHTTGTTASPTLPVLNGIRVGERMDTITDLSFGGRYSQIAVFDSALTDAQIVATYDIMVARHTHAGGVAPLSANVWIAEGDSITYNVDAAPNGPNYQGQYAAAGHSSVICMNNAVSGSNLSHLTTRLSSTLLTSRIQTAIANGYNVIVSVLIGANGIPTIAALETYWNSLKAAGAIVVACTVLPREDVNGGVPFNTDRAALNTQIRASAVPDAVADLAADADIGVDGAATAGVYYNADKVHLNAAGHAKALAVITPVLESLLTE